MVKTKKTTKKDITKMSEEEYKLKFLEDQIRHKKQTYDTYIKALIKYKMKDLPYSAIMYDELYHNQLMRNIEMCKDDDKSLTDLMFSSGRPTSMVEELEMTIEHYEKLIRSAQSFFEMATDEVKTKIAKDAVEKSMSWLTTPELIKEIKKKNQIQNDKKTKQTNKKTI